MNLIIDTQSIIWFSLNSSLLSPTAKRLMEDTQNDCWVSIGSYWEMSIKLNSGKLNMHGLSLSAFIVNVQVHGFKTLAISHQHVVENSKLPFFHRDPFDRLIIAQAISQNMSVISNDIAFDGYPAVNRIW